MSTYDGLTFAPTYVVDLEGRQAGIFRAHKGKRLITAHRKRGDTPFVGASRVNNSITDFASTPALFPGGWVTLIYNGDGGTGHAKYQPAPFSASDDVIALEPVSEEATEPALLLIASMLTHQCVPKFGFGYKLTLHRLARQKIMVPLATGSNGGEVVDWAGLNKLGEELMLEIKASTRSVRATEPEDDDTLPELTFEPRLITDVFETMKATSAWYNKSDLTQIGDGSYPFVSRTRENNGIDGWCVRQKKYPEEGNAITIGLDTQTIAYQPVPFYTSQNIQVLRSPNLNVDNAMLLATLIKQQMSRFGWGGNGATLGRLRKTRIMVPVAGGAINWNGMEIYGRALRVQAERRMGPMIPETKDALWGTRMVR
ncbi:Restriction enzyme BgcI subunit beta [Sphingopyxis sp. LC81]|uniref:restriction endonuclease subunit S n=1 Tax=Sphingopyxis sp. LC81 TaxID=1502850 RepID=UPI0005104F8F|nr:restriction endonuclease subunit S [Sphingopyxis sp. LC81]KGB53529.1 Restriction enzyme BgcI subunit beta [Sphingopyxis sp. LC81]